MARFPALGTTAEILVTEPSLLVVAERAVHAEIAAIDEAASRFRADSEISRLRPGAACPVSPLLAEALAAALRAARLTDGLVDPTVGQAVRALGYDDDFAAVAPDAPDAARPAGPAPGWWCVRLDLERGQVVVPRGVRLDLGATAKALAADRAARRAAAATACGVLVGLGGDIATSGSAPAGGWPVVVGDDHARTDPGRDPVVTVVSGGLATSSVTRRTWRRAGRTLHHIVDPRTGDVPPPVWRTVSVAAATCVDANTASTAAIVLGEQAPDWLTTRGLPARLVAMDGEVTTVAGWPA
ncbi:FAD:protein FMN transferase [Amycolatopsis alkalitolerans]|uniref:FAD:protein FMN transferase n=1 Tax=Amycolatopsis alkalitolerans TaxID=2547244 RepID=A0A5C4LWY9_9PSEU|nr:FAD:protein FMN transferase [Amycolatopsis alkalitolerans]